MSRKIEDYDSYNVPGLNIIPCSNINELAVYIHGVWTRQMTAKEQINRTILSLNLNGYNIPVLGLVGIQILL